MFPSLTSFFAEGFLCRRGFHDWDYNLQLQHHRQCKRCSRLDCNLKVNTFDKPLKLEWTEVTEELKADVSYKSSLRTDNDWVYKDAANDSLIDRPATTTWVENVKVPEPKIRQWQASVVVYFESVLNPHFITWNYTDKAEKQPRDFPGEKLFKWFMSRPHSPYFSFETPTDVTVLKRDHITRIVITRWHEVHS